jgi:hypothetical protein
MAAVTVGAISAPPAPPTSDWSAVIAVDLGTHGTSYAIAFPSSVTDLAQLAKDIIPRRPGSGAGKINGKVPGYTRLLLSIDT